jgi:membrane protease YdiL (CAAX protease family)
MLIMIALTHLERPRPQPVAPWWHTALLAALFLALAAAGLRFERQAVSSGAPRQHAHPAPLYLSLIVAEWGLFLYVRKGVRRTGTRLGDLIGGRGEGLKGVLVDLGLGLGTWVVWKFFFAAALARWPGATPVSSVVPFLPRRAIDVSLWILLSVSAGICEELVFRGYFERQLAAFAHSRGIALVLQALLFGISHGYQGFQACLRIAAYGALLGGLALWRGSLRPGMITHTLTDVLAGVFRI